jgi:hypothetical protein
MSVRMDYTTLEALRRQHPHVAAADGWLRAASDKLPARGIY